MADIVALNPVGSPSYHNHLYYRSGTRTTLPDSFHSVSWLDEGTVIGYSGDLNKPRLATISVTAGHVGTATPFPVDGSFAGTTGQ